MLLAASWHPDAQAQRLISAFLDNYHAWGIQRHTKRNQMKQAREPGFGEGAS